jgi:hypothetical protein
MAHAACAGMASGVHPAIERRELVHRPTGPDDVELILKVYLNCARTSAVEQEVSAYLEREMALGNIMRTKVQIVGPEDLNL